MIKNLQVSDLVEFFQDIPIYVGDEQGCEMAFQKRVSSWFVFDGLLRCLWRKK